MTIDFSNKAAHISIQSFENPSEWQKEILDFMHSYDGSKGGFIQKTSGSTGTPKNIHLSQKTIDSSALATINFFSLPENSKALLCIPIAYIGGKMMLIRSIHGKWLLECKEPKLQLDLKMHDYDFAAMIPSQVSYLIQNSPQTLQRIKNLIIGGASVSQQLENQICELNINAYSTYGMTETASHVALKKLDGKSEFKAVDGITFSSDDQSRLLIHGDRLTTSPLLTNDLVEIKSDKSFRWLGRADHVINSGGVKIISEELEQLISPYIQHSFYIKKTEHHLFGESPALVIKGDKWSDESCSDFLNELKRVLPKHWAPLTIEFKDEFQKTKNGKIKRV